MSGLVSLNNVLWATRGRSWGFRFLLDAGAADPLALYEVSFGESRDSPTVLVRNDGRLALRFSDPLGRKDTAGRTIPHEFVVEGALANGFDSVESAMQTFWPLVADGYAQLWGADHPPTAEEVRHLLQP